MKLAICESLYIKFSSVQFSRSVVSNSLRPQWIAALQASLSITNSWISPKLLSNELVIPSRHLILCRPLLLLPPIPPSIKVFSNESTLHMRWPKYWSFSFNISPSNGHPGLISFRMDWLGLLAVQGTLRSLLQHHSSKASILRWSAFFVSCQLSVVMARNVEGLNQYSTSEADEEWQIPKIFLRWNWQEWCDCESQK